MLMVVGVAFIATPTVLSLPLFDAAVGVTTFLSPSPLNGAGNSTGILLSSALVSLMWLRRGRSIGAMSLLAVLGVAAGIGA